MPPDSRPVFRVGSVSCQQAPTLSHLDWMEEDVPEQQRQLHGSADGKHVLQRFGPVVPGAARQQATGSARWQPCAGPSAGWDLTAWSAIAWHHRLAWS